MKIKNTKMNASIVTLTLIGSLAGGASAAITANLLSDPGFEDNNSLSSYGTVVGNFTTNEGLWGAESGSYVGSTNGVNPGGTMMFSQSSIGGNWGQTIQLTDLSAYTADISAGNATFDMSVYANAGSSGAVAGIRAIFYASASNSQISTLGSTRLNLDSAAITWESISLNGAIPTNATWMGTEIYYLNDSIENGPGFFDEACLSITVPEPSSTALIGLGGIGLILRRRKIA